jgi:hypothetical protein
MPGTLHRAAGYRASIAHHNESTTTWAAFIRTHLALPAGTDFFTAEVLTLRMLTPDPGVRDRLRGWGGETRTQKCCAQSLLANFDSAGRELSRDLKYIARAWLIHSFLSSSLTTPATQSVSALIGHRCRCGSLANRNS